MVIIPDAQSQPPQPPRPPSKQPRHYFSLPGLTWGNTRVLKCNKINRNGEPIDYKAEIQPIEEEKKAPSPVRKASNPPEQLTWNLRARKTPAMGNGSTDSPAVNVRTNPREQFRLSLTKDEITADFYKLTGRRPRQRPNKRPRDVQRILIPLFPGSYLSEMKLEERYKVEGQQ